MLLISSKSKDLVCIKTLLSLILYAIISAHTDAQKYYYYVFIRIKVTRMTK